MPASFQPSATHPPASDEDSGLVASLRCGSPEAFETMVRRHSPAMFAAARRILRHEDDAREALQDAFVSVFKAVGGFSGGAHLATWLHRIAVNAALMKLRARRRHPEGSIDDLLPRFDEGGHAVAPSEPWSQSASELLEREETRALVRRLVDELPDRHRLVIVLRDFEELSTVEVARMLDATPNAIKVRLHRARQALRAKLDPHYRMSPIP